MKFNLNPVMYLFDQYFSQRRSYFHEYHMWYAWCPIGTKGKIVWLEWIARKQNPNWPPGVDTGEPQKWLYDKPEYVLDAAKRQTILFYIFIIIFILAIVLSFIIHYSFFLVFAAITLLRLFWNIIITF